MQKLTAMFNITLAIMGMNKGKSQRIVILNPGFNTHTLGDFSNLTWPV